MSHYLEAWITGHEGEQFKKIHPWNRDFHPHITLVRPFIPRIDESAIKDQVIEASSSMRPIRVVAEGAGAFGKIQYIPITSNELGAYADALEDTIAHGVDFAPMLGDKRVLHLTIGRGKPIDSFPHTELMISRLTAMRNGRIWFAYDFQAKKELSREEVLDNVV